MFPGAGADREDAAYVIVGAPLEVSTTGRPGARYGPGRIRRLARSLEDYDRATDARFTERRVHDAGDVRAWDDAAEYLEYLTGELDAVVDAGAVPLLLGGEHTVSIAGIRAVAPTVVVSLDAHLDLRPDFDGNRLSHACAMRRALEVESVEELVVLGARAGSEAGWERAAAPDVTVVDPGAVETWSPPARLADERVYCTVDVDCVDPAHAPGTGTLEPFGPDARAVRDAVAALAPHVAGFDVVEVSDRDDGQAAALGGALLRRFVHTNAAGTSPHSR